MTRLGAQRPPRGHRGRWGPWLGLVPRLEITAPPPSLHRVAGFQDNLPGPSPPLGKLSQGENRSGAKRAAAEEGEWGGELPLL